MKNEALKFLKKICKNRVKVTKKMVIFFLMTGGLLLSQVNFSEEVDETKTATIKDLKDYTSEEVGKVKKEIEGLKEETIENLKNYDYPNSLHFVSVHYSKEDVKEYKDYYKYLDLLKKRMEYLKEIEIEKLNGNSREKIKKIKEEDKKLKASMEELKKVNKLISQKVTNEIGKNFKKPNGSDKDKKIEEINKEYTERIDKINKLSTNFNNLGIDFAHSIAIGKGVEIKGENGIAIGVNTLSGKDSISLGKDAIADGEGNIAIGRDATLFSKTFKGKVGQQIARILNDPNTIVKFENDGDVEYKKTIVIGDGTKSSGNSNIAIGDNAIAMKKRLTLINTNGTGSLSGKNGAEIDAKNWNDIAKQFYSSSDDQDKGDYQFEVKPVENAIALGKNASAFANNVIAIGKGAISGFESAVSIGENADTEGENSVAIGKNSKIFGKSSVAIGEGSRTGKIKYVLKTIDGKDTVENTEEFDTIEAAKQELEKKKEDRSKIYRIEVGGEKSENSVAIGKGSAVEYKGSVAIGADSLAVESNGKSAFTEVDHTSGETVSFGNSNKKRRLTNVADGKDSSDAVTVAQLQKAIADNKGGSGGSAVDSKLKLSDGKQTNPTTKDLSLKDDTLEIANGTNTTVSLSKDDTNKKATFKVDVKGDLTGITSIAKENGSKLTLNDDNITVNKKITGLEDGSISANSKDAINGGQLNTELDKKLNKADLDIQGDNKYINVTNTDKKYNIAFNEDNLKQLVNATDITNNNYLKTKLDTKANKDATNLEDTDVTKWQEKLGNGTIAEGNTGLVKGGVVKTYVDSQVQNVNTELAKKLNVDANNLSETGKTTLTNALGTGTITDDNTNLVTGGVVKTYVDSQVQNVNTELNKKLNVDDLDVTGDNKYINVTNTDKKYNIAFNEDNLKQLVNATDITNNNYLKTKLDTKANKDATNLEDTDVTKWQEKLGNGTIAEGNTGLVKGGVVKTYVDSQVQNVNTELAKKLNVDANNLSETGKTALTNALGTGTIADNNANLVTGGTVKKYITDEINNINTTVSGKLSSGDVDVKGDDYISVAKDKDKPNHYTLTFDKSKLGSDIDLTNNTKLNEKFAKYALLDGTNLNNDFNLTNWENALGKGTIENNGNGLVKGSTVYNYMTTFKQKLTEESNQNLSNKLATDASNLTDGGVTTLTNKLGTGEVAEGDTKLVTGGKVYTKLNGIKTDLDNKYKGLNTQVTTNTGDITALKTTVEGLKNTTQEINNIKTKLDDKLDKNDLSITGDNYITADKDDKFNYTLKVNKTKLESDLDLTNNTSVKNIVDNKLGSINTDFGNLKTNLTNSINSLTTKADNNASNITKLQQDMGTKLNADANNLSADGITNLTNKLSKDSNIAKPKDRLVTDRQVNTYLSRYNDALGVVDKKSTVALEKSELALGGVANAVAMANLVQVNSYSDYRHNLSAAYGYYGGSHALAVGFSGTNEERNFVYKLSGSVNNKGNLAFGVGAGVMLGDKDERLTTEYSTKLKTVEKDLVEANKKIKEYEERQKATDIKVKELERKLNQILNKH